MPPCGPSFQQHWPRAPLPSARRSVSLLQSTTSPPPPLSNTQTALAQRLEQRGELAQTCRSQRLSAALTMAPLMSLLLSLCLSFLLLLAPVTATASASVFASGSGSGSDSAVPVAADAPRPVVTDAAWGPELLRSSCRLRHLTALANSPTDVDNSHNSDTAAAPLRVFAVQQLSYQFDQPLFLSTLHSGDSSSPEAAPAPLERLYTAAAVQRQHRTATLAPVAAPPSMLHAHTAARLCCGAQCDSTGGASSGANTDDLKWFLPLGVSRTIDTETGMPYAGASAGADSTGTGGLTSVWAAYLPLDPRAEESLAAWLSDAVSNNFTVAHPASASVNGVVPSKASAAALLAAAQRQFASLAPRSHHRRRSSSSDGDGGSGNGSGSGSGSGGGESRDGESAVSVDANELRLVVLSYAFDDASATATATASQPQAQSQSGLQCRIRFSAPPNSYNNTDSANPSYSAAAAAAAVDEPLPWIAGWTLRAAWLSDRSSTPLAPALTATPPPAPACKGHGKGKGKGLGSKGGHRRAHGEHAGDGGDGSGENTARDGQTAHDGKATLRGRVIDDVYRIDRIDPTSRAGRGRNTVTIDLVPALANSKSSRANTANSASNDKRDFGDSESDAPVFMETGFDILRSALRKLKLATGHSHPSPLSGNGNGNGSGNGAGATGTMLKAHDSTFYGPRAEPESILALRTAALARLSSPFGASAGANGQSDELDASGVFAEIATIISHSSPSGTSNAADCDASDASNSASASANATYDSAVVASAVERALPLPPDWAARGWGDWGDFAEEEDPVPHTLFEARPEAFTGAPAAADWAEGAGDGVSTSYRSNSNVIVNTGNVETDAAASRQTEDNASDSFLSFFELAPLEAYAYVDGDASDSVFLETEATATTSTGASTGTDASASASASNPFPPVTAPSAPQPFWGSDVVPRPGALGGHDPLRRSASGAVLPASAPYPRPFLPEEHYKPVAPAPGSAAAAAAAAGPVRGSLKTSVNAPLSTSVATALDNAEKTGALPQFGKGAVRATVPPRPSPSPRAVPFAPPVAPYELPEHLQTEVPEEKDPAAPAIRMRTGEKAARGSALPPKMLRSNDIKRLGRENQRSNSLTRFSGGTGFFNGIGTVYAGTGDGLGNGQTSYGRNPIDAPLNIWVWCDLRNPIANLMCPFPIPFLIIVNIMIKCLVPALINSGIDAAPRDWMEGQDAPLQIANAILLQLDQVTTLSSGSGAGSGAVKGVPREAVQEAVADAQELSGLLSAFIQTENDFISANSASNTVNSAASGASSASSVGQRASERGSLLEQELLSHMPIARSPQSSSASASATAVSTAAPRVPNALARMLSTKYTKDPFALVPDQLRDARRRARDRDLVSAFIESRVDVALGGRAVAAGRAKTPVPPASEVAAAAAARALLSGDPRDREATLGTLDATAVEDAWAASARVGLTPAAAAEERRQDLVTAAQDRALSPGELAELFAGPLPGFEGTTIAETLARVQGHAAPVAHVNEAGERIAAEADDNSVPAYTEDLAAARDAMLRKHARAHGVSVADTAPGQNQGEEEEEEGDDYAAYVAREAAEEAMAPFLWSRASDLEERGSRPLSGGIPLAALIETSAAADALAGTEYGALASAGAHASARASAAARARVAADMGMDMGMGMGDDAEPVNSSREGIIPIFKSELFTRLVNRLTMTMAQGSAEQISAQTMPLVFDKVTDVGKRILPDATSHAITHVLTAALPLTVGTTVPELLLRLLPSHVVRRATVGAMNTIGRAVTHAMTHTMVWALGQSPLVHYYCYYCKYHSHYCDECHGSMRQGTPTALYHGEYYASFYSDYYTDYYGTEELWEQLKRKGS